MGCNARKTNNKQTRGSSNTEWLSDSLIKQARKRKFVGKILVLSLVFPQL
jgi:hypothetical protein